jgi:hypothetical protein
MALVKQENYLWFDIQKYAKINEFRVSETGQDEIWKLYSAFVWINFYTNPDKQYKIDTIVYHIQWLRLENLNLEWMYVWLKTLSDFEWREDLI